MEIRLTYDTGEVVSHRIIPVDLVAFERRYKLGWDEVKASPKMEHTLFLAWNSAHRCQQTPLTFDEWLETVTDLEPDTDEGSVPLPQPSDS